MELVKYTIIFLVSTTFFIQISASSVNSKKAREFLIDYNKKMKYLQGKIADVKFRLETNITSYNSALVEKAGSEFSLIVNEMRANASRINLTGTNSNTRRQFNLILASMTSQDPQVLREKSALAVEMENTYSKARVPYDERFVKSLGNTSDGFLNLGHLSEILATSTDEKELRYAWEQWRKAVGPPLREKYVEFVKLNNIGARENGFEDAGDFYHRKYEVENLDDIAEKFWNELKPFYQELHAYVRYRLKEVYPNEIEDGEPLPAHLLGNMWGQEWDNIYKHVIPYKSQPSLDVTKALLEKKYNVTQMCQTAEQFFQSIGWGSLPKSFWEKSMFVRPKDRAVACHPSAWDFYQTKNGEKDVRIKMCTKVNEVDFTVIHHEVGHLYYFLLYWDQPFAYRKGANPGFHEAVGETLELSVRTPFHLKKIGLLDRVSNTTESDINFLLAMALKKIAFIPFGYLVDQWKWKVYSGEIPPSHYNRAWWKMKLEYQGIKPPGNRREEEFFDPGAKFHVPAGVPYIRYFFSSILQFAFHKHACKKAGNTKPLHHCSIYGSKKAGRAFGDMLKLGKSKEWPEALEQFTGSREISAEPMNEYFALLITWLKEQRKEHEYKLGWEEEKNSSANILDFSLLYLICLLIFLFM